MVAAQRWIIHLFCLCDQLILMKIFIRSEYVTTDKFYVHDQLQYIYISNALFAIGTASVWRWKHRGFGRQKSPS